MESIELSELLELYGLGVFAVTFEWRLLLKSELLLRESRAAPVRWNLWCMASGLKLSYDSDLWHSRISERPTAPIVDSQLYT